MKFLRCILILLLPFAMLALGQSAPEPKPSSLPNQPEALARSLYTQVVARAPSGLLYGAGNRKVFDPYLSELLLHRIQLADACSKDWLRKNRGRAIKAPFEWSESGLFSGGNERTSPGDFQIERIQREKDGLFRVNVKLTYRPQDGPGSWRVAAVLVLEDGRLAVDDVIYLKDPDRSDQVDTSLSKVLAHGCEGPHWVGDRDPN